MLSLSEIICVMAWPFKTAQELCESCPQCARDTKPSKEPLVPTSLPACPWQKFLADLFHLNRCRYSSIIHCADATCRNQEKPHQLNILLESQRGHNTINNNNPNPAHNMLYELVVHTMQISMHYSSHVGGYNWSSSYISPTSF